MSNLFQKLTDTADFGLQTASGAYAWKIGSQSNGGHEFKSPSGQYWASGDYYDVWTLVDTSDPPSHIWTALLSAREYGGFLSDTLTGFLAFAVDDEGSLWGNDGFSTGYITEVPKDTRLPIVRYQWTDFAGQAEGGKINAVFTFTMPDGSIKLVVLPGEVTWNSNPLYFTATKGNPALTTNTTGGTWYAAWAFQDDHGDIWIAGTPQTTGNVTTLKALRITNVGSSPYASTLQTFTMPAIAGNGVDVTEVVPWGFFSGGHFVGGWCDGSLQGHAETLFKAALDGSETVTTRDISSAPVYVNLQPYSASPAHFFVQKVSNRPNDPEYGEQICGRIFNEIDQDTLADGAEYNLDDWAAGESTPPMPAIVYSNIYLNNRFAFLGNRWFFTDAPTNNHQQTDLFIYYFSDGEGDGGGGGGGGTVATTTIRSWGFSLDGHDFIVLQTGSESLIYDISAQRWSEWKNETLDFWRPVCGMNWVGMAGTLADGATDIVGGDYDSGILWRLDPTKGRDDLTTTGDESFTRTVTAGFSLTGRDVRQCNAVELTVALGSPSQTGAAFTLTTSDDLGETWLSHGTETITAGDFSSVIEWRGLGLARAPGRLFKITDNGATVRLAGADLR